MNKIRLRQMKTGGYLLILIAIMLLTSSVVGAEVVTWNAAGGSWDTAANWSPVKVPVPVDEVVVDISGTYTISVDADVTISSLTIETGAGTLTLNSGVFTIAGGMVLVPGGCFDMGDTFGDGYAQELPVHQVCLSSFSIDRTEVTQSAYQAAMGGNPSYFTGDGSRPVEQVTWTEAVNYCQAVGKRLPTEAEWEYAARSRGQSQKYAGTSDLGLLPNYGWFWDNSSSTTHGVGQKSPNGLGLYDMSGNVWEWVADWYGAYPSSAQNNPTGPATGAYRVVRGGGWLDGAVDSRASGRSGYFPGSWGGFVGFRCARTN